MFCNKRSCELAWHPIANAESPKRSSPEDLKPSRVMPSRTSHFIARARSCSLNACTDEGHSGLFLVRSKGLHELIVHLRGFFVGPLKKKFKVEGSDIPTTVKKRCSNGVGHYYELLRGDIIATLAFRFDSSASLCFWNGVFFRTIWNFVLVSTTIAAAPLSSPAMPTTIYYLPQLPSS